MSERLSREDWLRFGLETLAHDGHGALKADTLARALGVSRGSFYWHFTDLAAFHAALLGHWRERYSDGIIRSLTDEPTSRAKLTKLLERTFEADPSLERALRAWSIADPLVREVIDATDKVRLDYVERLLADHGVPARRVAARARLAYWAYLGQAMLGERPSAQVRKASIEDLVTIATQT
jgi:AcrR family transcriptional regulator